MKVGCHLSIQGGIEHTFRKAKELNCETFQVFTQNQRQWISKEFNRDTIEEFKIQRQKFGYENHPIVAHASYLINLCANQPDKLKRSTNAFMEELKRCDTLGIDFIVIHPGAHGGNGENWGIRTIAGTLNTILNDYQPKVKILLETIAGQGTGIGYSFTQLAAIINATEADNFLGICLDTCHMYASGYDIGSQDGWIKTLDEIDNTTGINRIGCVHINDSKFPVGSKRDRHASIGNGFIDIKGFRSMMNIKELKNIPGILEVPGGESMFINNLNLLKSFRE